MNLINYFLTFIGSSITIYFELLAYSKMSKNKLSFNIKNLIIILITGLIVTLNIYFTDNGIIRTLISFLVLLTSANILFKNRFSKCLFYTIIWFIVGMFYEIILSVLVLNVVNYNYFENNIIIKTSFSFLIIILMYLTISNKYGLKIIDQLLNKINKKYLTTIVFTIFLIVLFIVDYGYISTFSKEVYISNIIIVGSLLILLVINLYNNYRIMSEIQKSDSLLKFITKYEKIIDEDRINRHEMLNNLLTLKSIKNKNSKEFKNYLDELIGSYNNGISIKNVYKLPSGLKGIFYYKLVDLQNENYNISINISKRIENDFKKIDDQDYILLCKIVGILLDNSVDAIKESNDKYIGIDVYKEKEDLIIVIDNSFSGNIDIDKMSEKYYSTKGTNRGLGLYLLNRLLSRTNNINVIQSLNNNLFSSKIEIKMSKQ